MRLYRKFKEKFGDKAFEAGLLIGIFIAAAYFGKDRRRLYKNLGKATYITLSVNKVKKL